MRAPIWMAAALIAALPGLAMAQDKAKTLADLRAELTRLAQDIQGLRAELVASGPEGMRAAGGVTALDRLNSMEAALAQLTGQTEALGKRIDRVVTDGTNRIAVVPKLQRRHQTGGDALVPAQRRSTVQAVGKRLQPAGRQRPQRINTGRARAGPVPMTQHARRPQPHAAL